MTKTACVTGASGMIGGRICERLLAGGYRVKVLSRRKGFALGAAEVFEGGLEDEGVLKRFVDGAQLLFHCAGELRDEAKMRSVNVEGTRKIMAAAEAAGVEFFCHLSSAGVIGAASSRVLDESSPCRPQNAYETSKWEAERLAARGLKGCRTVILRPTNVVDGKHLGILELPVRGSWKDVCKAALKGGEGAHIVHVEDVADAALYFVDRPLDGVYIVSCDHEPSNTVSGLWALYRGRAVPHLPLFVPHLLRRLIGRVGNRGDVVYSSEKLRKAGFTFKLGVRGAVERIAAASGQML